MPGSDLLLALAEIGVALAGLGSLVAVFVRRGGEVRELDMPRLWLVLEFSLGLSLFAVLPLPLAHLGLSHETAFRLAGLVLATALLGHVSLSWFMRRRMPELRGSFPPRLAAVLLLGHVAAALLLLGAWLEGAVAPAGAYLVAASWLLVAAVVNFVRLVFVMAPR